MVSGADFGFGADTGASGAGDAEAGARWHHLIRSIAVIVAAVALGLLIARHEMIDVSINTTSNGTPSAAAADSGTTTVPVRANVKSTAE